MRNKSTVQPGETLKWCSKCETEKSLDQFSKNRARPDGLQNYCKSCAYQAHRDSLLKSRGASGENQRRWYKNKSLKDKYGITLDDFELMILEQNSKCVICHEEMLTPHIDQDASGKVRSLLCGSCYDGLKNFRDSAELLLRGVSYLDSYTQKGRPLGDPSLELDAEMD